MEPEHQAWKKGVLNGSIQLEEIDTSPYWQPSNQTPSDKLEEKGVSPVEAAAPTA